MTMDDDGKRSYWIVDDYSCIVIPAVIAILAAIVFPWIARWLAH